MELENRCQNCQALLEEGQPFCHECGAQLLKFCSVCNNKLEPDDIFCNNCGRRTDLKLDSSVNNAINNFNSKIADSKKRKFPIVSLCLLLLLILVSVFSFMEISNLHNQLALKEREYERLQGNFNETQNVANELKERVDDMQAQINFMERYIALIPSNSSVYHKYSCSVWQNYSGSWRAYNEVAAVANGYYPCSQCQ